jgi:CTP synthase (UTP-ammonia lyase)
MVRIGVIGDYRPANATHVATGAALAHAGIAAGIELEHVWVPTPQVAAGPEGAVDGLDAVLIAPGSPYESIDGALAAIEAARAAHLPLLGTCGGFQHVIVEFARDVLGITDAAHAEYGPSAGSLFITALECSLRGRQMTVTLVPGSVAAAAYPAATAAERYYCDFGLNPAYRGQLTAAGLMVSGTDEDGEVRIVELPGHRFFLATLFVPQASSAPGRPHPLLSAFVAAAARITPPAVPVR